MAFPTRRASVAIALLEHPNGISGREIDFKYFLNCGRNEVNHFIHEGVNILKSDEKGNRGGLFYNLSNRKPPKCFEGYKNPQYRAGKMQITTAYKIRNLSLLETF